MFRKRLERQVAFVNGDIIAPKQREALATTLSDASPWCHQTQSLVAWRAVEVFERMGNTADVL
ncbi:MAG: hypothetical protein R2712_09245 [Vicinamibacterales bacterium]